MIRPGYVHLRVTDLETVGSRVYALWASCTGTGAAYAGGCSAFTLYSASARGGAWAPVGRYAAVLTTVSRIGTSRLGRSVFAGAFGLGSKGQSEKSNETVNRIQFSVPLSLPISTPDSRPNR